MKAYDYTEKAKHEQAKQQSLEAIEVRLARHEKVTRTILIVVLILAGLALALLATHLFEHSI
jgi:cell division protein FtsL